jgi:hypothetical protein
LVLLSFVYHAEVTPLPGANTSRHVPKFENDARLSDEVVAPTVMAAVTRAGEELHALALLLPAAMEYVTPAAMELFTALSMDVEALPPRLMLATAGLTWFRVTQSMPAITPDSVPEPLQLSTRTA